MMKHRHLFLSGEKLAQQFAPELFDWVKPLQHGVIEQLLEQLEPEQCSDLRSFLISYTHSEPYLSCIIEGRSRFDINGQAVGCVTRAEMLLAQRERYWRQMRELKSELDV